MDILTSIKGSTAVNVTPNTATATTVVSVAAGTNVRGVILWRGTVQSADVMDSDVRIEKVTGGNNVILAGCTRGGNDRTENPILIPAGEALQYVSRRQAKVNFIYTIL